MEARMILKPGSRKAMAIEYRTQKDIPCHDLYKLFLAVGWAKEGANTPEQIEHFNVGFRHSAFVFSAWDGNKLVGCVRALSDLHFRSVIYDLAVLPEYQHKGIGKELVSRCIAACPSSEWLVQTDKARGFYEKLGFRPYQEDVLSIPCKWF